MFKLTCIDFFFRTIPETFILIYGIHTISQKSINIHKYILSGLILSILIFFIRELPIYFGVHTEFSMVATMFTMLFVDIPLILNIQSTFLIYLMLSLSEFVNMLLLNKAQVNTDISILEPLIRCLYGIPSLIILILLIISIKFLLKKRRLIIRELLN
ncbi:hypothetical protein [Clostridium beijerinckii]|uniref:hypothetical protein n=1 Tax=Clostridium beijerinckii TaxID=1520 RepID=UPI001F1D3AA5|nr:hypothetical protein [Clostridium beijerinckii]